MIQEPKGKLIGFRQVKLGETVLKLNDGNYLKVSVIVHKVLKDEELFIASKGNAGYVINSQPVISIWKPSEIAELDLDENQEKTEK